MAKGKSKLEQMASSITRRGLYLGLSTIGVLSGVTIAMSLTIGKPVDDPINKYETQITTQVSEQDTSDPTVPPSADEGETGLEALIAEKIAAERAKYSEADCTEPESDLDGRLIIKRYGPCNYVMILVDNNGEGIPVDSIDHARQILGDESELVDWEKLPAAPSDSNSAAPDNSPSESNSRAERPQQEATPATPAPAPEPSVCPLDRGSNPAVYDACRAGFAMPNLVASGITSCSGTEDGTLTASFDLRLEGGNYRGTTWIGHQPSNTVTVHGTGGGGHQLIATYNVTIHFGSMDGRYMGDIATQTFVGQVEDDISGCF